MGLTRRAFFKTALTTLAFIFGPHSLSGRKSHSATKDTPELLFLTPSEYRTIKKLSFEIIPDEPVLDGTVDVALNIDRFFANVNVSKDFLIMFQYLRLIKLASPFITLIEKLSPATAEDIMSFKRTICFLGYYSDANGEAELSPEKRIVWKRIGYGGPKPDGWEPPVSEPRVDPKLLIDRIKEELE